MVKRDSAETFLKFRLSSGPGLNRVMATAIIRVVLNFIAFIPTRSLDRSRIPLNKGTSSRLG